MENSSSASATSTAPLVVAQYAKVLKRRSKHPVIRNRKEIIIALVVLLVFDCCCFDLCLMTMSMDVYDRITSLFWVGSSKKNEPKLACLLGGKTYMGKPKITANSGRFISDIPSPPALRATVV